jgi:hypothetical protein
MWIMQIGIFVLGAAAGALIVLRHTMRMERETAAAVERLSAIARGAIRRADFYGRSWGRMARKLPPDECMAEMMTYYDDAPPDVRAEIDNVLCNAWPSREKPN